MFAAHLEPCFVGRVDVGFDGTGKPEDFRGGFILPSHAACFVPGPSDVVSDNGGETGRAQGVRKYYEYEVLQVSFHYLYATIVPGWPYRKIPLISLNNCSSLFTGTGKIAEIYRW